MKKKALLKHNLLCLLLLFAFGNGLPGQTREFDLKQANCQKYNSSLFIYGFSGTSKNASFCIYKSNFKLRILDSMIVDRGNASANDYLQTYSDTLHGFLNVYLQRKDKKLVTILRFNKNFKLVTTIENVDVARLNSISGFENELFYFKNQIYTIRTQTDTSGRQFYLNKYILKSDSSNFEYKAAWQFPFERKNINSAHIFYADHKQVMMYINVNNGIKQGQWVLKINAQTGQLQRGSKLNERGDHSVYEFGNFIADTVNKKLFLAGQVFQANQWKENSLTPTIVNAPFAFIYLIEIDSTGYVTSRDQFKAPIVDLKSGAKKQTNAYLLRIAAMTKNTEEKLFLETDVYKSADNFQTFLYSNTCLLTIAQGDEQLILEKCSITVNPLIEKFYVVPDKMDINGKLFNDTLGQFEKLFYKTITFPVKQDFKLAEDGNPSWVLKKSYPKKNTVSFSLLAPVKKIYQLSSLENLAKSTEPVFTALSDSFFIISNQVSEERYLVKLAGW